MNSIDNTSYPIPFNILRKDTAKSEILLDLKYPSSFYFSNFDMIRIKTIKKIQIMNKNFYTTLKEDEMTEAKIPR
jgi:hypothetical protein